VFKVQIPSPSYVVDLWKSCHDGDKSKYNGGKFSTDNMTIVEKYWGECLVINYFRRIFMLTLWSFLGGNNKAGWSGLPDHARGSILAPPSVSQIM